MTRSTLVVAMALAAIAVVSSVPARSADIVAEWSNVKAPPAPELKPVKLDGKTTALLILDVQKPSCTPERRPRCVDILPKLKALMEKARAAGATVIYTFAGEGDPKTIADPTLAPKDGEWMAQRGPDKFLGSDLEKRLKDKGIKTVIVTGTSSQGVVIGTGSGAAQRGYKVIVPVDGTASESAYNEQYAIWHMAKGGPAVVTDQTTVTRSDLITF
ncbi:MAG: cysteine hydrolase family protein [Gemmatimonas sp.]